MARFAVVQLCQVEKGDMSLSATKSEVEQRCPFSALACASLLVKRVTKVGGANG